MSQMEQSVHVYDSLPETSALVIHPNRRSPAATRRCRRRCEWAVKLEANQNAKRNSDKQNAGIEHDKSLERVMMGIEGRVMFENERLQEQIEVGRIEAHLIGMHCGADIREIAYWHMDEDIEPLHACLFDRFGRMRPNVARLYGGDAFVDSLLYVESIEVVVDHRGREVGLKAMKALLRHFAHQVTLAFCKPYRIYRAGELRERGRPLS